MIEEILNMNIYEIILKVCLIIAFCIFIITIIGLLQLIRLIKKSRNESIEKVEPQMKRLLRFIIIGIVSSGLLSGIGILLR